MHSDVNAWLPKKGNAVIGQGLTGSEGTRALETMRAYGTNVVAGVTPGKGGTMHCGIPIFDTVLEALLYSPQIRACVQYVPAPRVLAAGREAIKARVPLLVVGAERVPVQDAARLFAYAQTQNTRLLGPSSIGIIGTHESIKLGFIGGGNPERAFKKGTIAIVSKSGGMTSEIGIHLSLHGLGVSWAVGTGGERIIASDFADIATALEADSNTDAIVVYGEFGGSAEERLAESRKSGKITKPIVALIIGEFAQKLPAYTPFGHAGAFIEDGRGGAESKRERLRSAGIHVVASFDDIGPTITGLIPQR